MSSDIIVSGELFVGAAGVGYREASHSGAEQHSVANGDLLCLLSRVLDHSPSLGDSWFIAQNSLLLMLGGQ